MTGNTVPSLGLKHGVNTLVDYDPLWAIAFDDEKEKLAKALGPLARGIEHYGSTSVPGLRAKPVIDIMVGVVPLEGWEKCRAPLEALGYDYAENAGVPGHYIFGRGRDKTERTHLVHVVEFEGASWRRCLAFRDALRDDGELRAEYAQEKERAIAAAPEGRGAYNAAKGAFIERETARVVKQDNTGEIVLETLGRIVGLLKKIDKKMEKFHDYMMTPSRKETGFFTANKRIALAVLAAIILGLYFLT